MRGGELVEEDDGQDDLGEDRAPDDAGLVHEERGARHDGDRDAGRGRRPRPHERRVHGRSPGQADDDPGVADDVGQDVPAEERQVEHDDEQAPGGPCEPGHAATLGRDGDAGSRVTPGGRIR